MIDLSEQCWVDSVVAEVSVKENTSFFQSPSNPIMNSIWICEKDYVLLLKETETISLTMGKQLFHQSLFSSFYMIIHLLMKSLEYEPSGR